MCKFNAAKMNVIAHFVTPLRLYYLIVNAHDRYLSRLKDAHLSTVSNTSKIIEIGLLATKI